MKAPLLKLAVVLLPLCAMSLAGCSQKDEDQEPGKSSSPVISAAGLPPVQEVHDKIAQDVSEFRNRTRNLYNNRRFDELETLATKLRADKARFGNGSWMLYRFYECQDCREEEPELTWQLHAQIHNDWIVAKPQSITARVAYANFLVRYAWHARGSGYANTVTKEGWRLFSQRLADARKVLDDATSLQEKCPMWWRVRMTIARGQSWNRAEYEKLFAEAKSMEPEFWSYDVEKACYLLPRWHGKSGDWEAAAIAEAKRPGGLGLEAYARVVIAQSAYYDDIFRETKASWPDTRQGLDILRKKYPTSLEILSEYCKLACSNDDRNLAKRLFDEIGGRMEANIWADKEYFIECRNWAYSK